MGKKKKFKALGQVVPELLSNEVADEQTILGSSGGKIA